MIGGEVAFEASGLRPYDGGYSGGLAVFHAALDDHARLVVWGEDGDSEAAIDRHECRPDVGIGAIRATVLTKALKILKVDGCVC